VQALIAQNFRNGETTGINDEYSYLCPSQDWYTLDGRKLLSKPTKKGLYIYQGKTTVIQ
jgi:hypothetical protein